MPRPTTETVSIVLGVLDRHIYRPGVQFDSAYRPPSCTCLNWVYKSALFGGHNRHIAECIAAELEAGS